jgi:hypothetical protein
MKGMCWSDRYFVEFTDDKAAFEGRKNDGSGQYITGSSFVHCEIIGNICEEP